MKEINENFFAKYGGKDKFEINDYLKKGEKVLWKGCPKKIAHVIQKTMNLMPIAILWAAIDFSLLISVFSAPNMGFGISLFLLFFFALHLTPFWIWLRAVIKVSNEMKHTMYYITNTRIIEIKGKSAYIANEITIKNIKEVNLNRSSIDNLLKTGDIYITSNNGSLVIFDIPDSVFIAKKIKELTELVFNEDKFYKNERTCPHCGSSLSAEIAKCPNCGSTTKE